MVKRLALLVKRSLRELSLKRCQALNVSGLQCTHFGDILRGTVWVCPSHNRQAINEYIPSVDPPLLPEVRELMEPQRPERHT